jgi:hypothetical protein
MWREKRSILFPEQDSPNSPRKKEKVRERTSKTVSKLSSVNRIYLYVKTLHKVLYPVLVPGTSAARTSNYEYVCIVGNRV